MTPEEKKAADTFNIGLAIGMFFLYCISPPLGMVVGILGSILLFSKGMEEAKKDREEADKEAKKDREEAKKDREEPKE
jgi:predicted histidine transporter YuiF (NhaC family)